MNRVIIPEELPKEENQEQQVTQSQNVNFGGKVTISAEELEQIFYEWDATGKNDLFVDESIAEKIKAYLAYQKKLKPLRVKLAEEQFERFLVHDSTLYRKTSVYYTIYLNDVLIGTAKIFYKNEIYGYMYFDDFRIILSSCKNPCAYYPYKDEERIIDVRGWVLEHGGSFKQENSSIKIEL